MKTGWTAALVAVFFLACSSSDDDTGPCATRNGSYLARFTTRSGDCGPQDEALINITDNVTSAAPECTGEPLTVDANNCNIRGNQTCPVPSMPGYAVTSSSTVTWSRDGSSAGGLFEITVTRDGAHFCHGTYDVRIAKQ